MKTQIINLGARCYKVRVKDAGKVAAGARSAIQIVEEMPRIRESKITTPLQRALHATLFASPNLTAYVLTALLDGPLAECDNSQTDV